MKRTVSGLGVVTAAALLTNGIAYLIYFFLVASVAGFIVPILVIAILTLLATGFVAKARVRPAPLLGAILVLLSSGLDLAQPETLYNLAHPVPASFYALNVIILASALVACVSGIGATIQNYRGPGARLPQGSRIALAGIGGIVIGLILTALIASANPLVGATGANPGGEPTVHMGPGGFVENVVLVPKGSRLRLIDDGAFLHVLRNGTWSASGTAMPATEPGAPVISNLQINGGSVEIGPFNTAGEFDIYCTIHVGMNLTVVVE
jgi:hypothetical protein